MDCLPPLTKPILVGIDLVIRSSEVYSVRRSGIKRPATPLVNPLAFTFVLLRRAPRFVSTITVSLSSGNRVYSVPVTPAWEIILCPRTSPNCQPKPYRYDPPLFNLTGVHICSRLDGFTTFAVASALSHLTKSLTLEKTPP